MRILVTGGAGFIGSNLVEALLKADGVSKVVVLDNLSTGFKKNIESFLENKKFEFIEGDIRDYKKCLEAVSKVDIISHQAALGSVPRSIEDPITTNEVNIGGTLNIFNAARDKGITKIVFASSSSVYGDCNNLPQVESVIGNPLSPYAVTKQVNEKYAQVFYKNYGINFIGLRYFNVFGPKQNPEGAYAAVIPKFIKALMKNEQPVIFGDGGQSRDFTFIDNVIQANLKSLFCEDLNSWNHIYNIACGKSTSVLELFNAIAGIMKSEIKPIYKPLRNGEILNSFARIENAKVKLKYKPEFDLEKSLAITVNYYLC